MQEKFETFAIINLFGHHQLAGKVTEQSIGGATFIRVDVPETTKQPTFTRYLNPSAIYDINPVTEEVVNIKAESLQVTPITMWDIREVVKRNKLALAEDNSEEDEPWR